MTVLRSASMLSIALAFVAGIATAGPVMSPAPQRLELPSLLRVDFHNRVTKTLDLPTFELQQARRRMLAGEPISWNDMRALADYGDGLAAFRFARRIEEQGDPALLSDAAFYYANAAFTNRDYAVGPLVRILQRRDVEFSPRRLEHIENALRARALAGDEKAIKALTDFYVSGHPFGRQPERALEFRLELAEAGDADAAMALVLETMSNNSPVPLDEEQIARLFEVVSTSDDLGLRTTGENLRRLYETGTVSVRPPAREAITQGAQASQETAP